MWFDLKEVLRNTFSAFTGKLDKPIESKFRGEVEWHLATESREACKVGICRKPSNYQRDRITWQSLIHKARQASLHYKKQKKEGEAWSIFFFASPDISGFSSLSICNKTTYSKQVAIANSNSFRQSVFTLFAVTALSAVDVIMTLRWDTYKRTFTAFPPGLKPTVCLVLQHNSLYFARRFS